MPPTDVTSSSDRTLDDVVASGVYWRDAYFFVEEGLRRAIEQAYGKERGRRVSLRPTHISGQQLCEGLRELAIERWGLMAPAVLATWKIHCTLDFGKIVFSLIEAKLWQKQPQDTIDDFANVYDFRRTFVTDYRIAVPKAIS